MISKDPVLLRHFRGHKGTITSLSYNPVNDQLASGSVDESIIIWFMANDTNSSLRYIARKFPINCVHFAPKGNFLASAQDCYVRLWVPSVHGKSTEFKAHLSKVRCVQFSPDGNQLVTCADDKSLKLWSSAKRSFVASMTGHTNWVRAARYSSDGSLIVSCSDDKSIRIWDPKTAKLIHTFNEVRGIPRDVSFHPNDTCLGVALSHHVVKLYDLKNLKLLQYYNCHEGPVNALSFHPDGNYMITASDDCSSKVIDLIEGHAVITIEGHKEPVTAVSFSKTGRYFATGSADKQVFSWRSNLEGRISVTCCTELRESVKNNCRNDLPRVSAAHSAPLGDRPQDVIYSADNYEESSPESCEVPSSNGSENTTTDDSTSCRFASDYTPLVHLGAGDAPNVNKPKYKNVYEALEALESEHRKLEKQLSTMDSRIKKIAEMIQKKVTIQSSHPSS